MWVFYFYLFFYVVLELLFAYQIHRKESLSLIKQKIKGNEKSNWHEKWYLGINLQMIKLKWITIENMEMSIIDHWNSRTV